MPDAYVTIVSRYVQRPGERGYSWVTSWDGRTFDKEPLAVMNGWRTTMGYTRSGAEVFDEQVVLVDENTDTASKAIAVALGRFRERGW